MTAAVVSTRTRSRAIAYSAIAVGVVVAVLVALLATRRSAADRQTDSPLLGKPAPAFVGKDINGKTIRLDDYRGKFVVLNFFASWCVPCHQEHPELIKFVNEHRKSADATVVSVTFDDSNSAARDFFRTNGGDWDVVDDTGGEIALDFGVRGPPESFVIDPDGYVRTKVVGRSSQSGLNDLIARIKASS